MAKLNWSLKDEGTLVATGDDTGAVFEVSPFRDGYVLRVSDRIESVSGSLFELMSQAESMDRDEDPNNTFRDDFAGFAPNH